MGGDRPERPRLTVDTDLIYFRGMAGFKVARDLFITGGVRRLALNYDIQLNDLPTFSRKPGLWDPLIGLAWHRVGDTLEWHGVIEGGGFGVGFEPPGDRTIERLVVALDTRVHRGTDRAFDAGDHMHRAFALQPECTSVGQIHEVIRLQRRRR